MLSYLPRTNQTDVDEETQICVTLSNNQCVNHQYWWLAGGYDLEMGHF